MTGGSTAPKHRRKIPCRKTRPRAMMPVDSRAETMASCPAEKAARSGCSLPKYWEITTAPPVVRAAMTVMMR